MRIKNHWISKKYFPIHRLPEATNWTVLTRKHQSTSLVVKGLSFDREYVFRVKAVNVHGQSHPSQVSQPVSFQAQALRNEEKDLDHSKEDEKERKVRKTIKR